MSRKFVKQLFSTRLLVALVFAIGLGIGVAKLLSLPQPTQAQTAYPTFEVAPDGFMVINGKRTFMFGFNHVADVRNRYGLPMAQDVERMGRAGFNLVQMSITELDNTILAMNMAKKYNMYNIASYYKPGLDTWLRAMGGQAFNGQYKDILRQTVMAWNTGDDFNTPHNNPKYTPATLKTYNDNLKNAALGYGFSTLTFGSGGGYPFTRTPGPIGYRTVAQVPYLLGDYINSTDIFASQSYPISNTDGAFQGAPLEEHIAYMRYGREQFPNKPFMPNPQMFAWQGGRYPTPCESRNMTWAAMISGVNGIMNYAYHEESGTLHSVQPSLWVEQIRLRRDINGRFLEAVVNGTRTYTDTNPTAPGKGKIHAASWEYTEPGTNKKYVYVVALNTDQTKLNTVQQKIKLPAAVAGKTMRPLFGSSLRYGTTMNLQQYGNDYYLDGEIKAQETQVYVFE